MYSWKESPSILCCSVVMAILMPETPCWPSLAGGTSHAARSGEQGHCSSMAIFISTKKCQIPRAWLGHISSLFSHTEWGKHLRISWVDVLVECLSHSEVEISEFGLKYIFCNASPGTFLTCPVNDCSDQSRMSSAIWKWLCGCKWVCLISDME